MDWRIVKAVLRKDLLAVRRSKSIIIPMITVPGFLLILTPLFLGLVAYNIRGNGIADLAASIPGAGNLVKPIVSHPAGEQIFYLLYGYLLAPLFVIVPLMVAAVLAADAFAGEKERHTLEGILHLPVSERDLFAAKVLAALLPAVAISWTAFGFYVVIANAVSWHALHHIFMPNPSWLGLIFWLGPAIAAFGLSIIVRVSARARSTQEANQLGGAVILPLVFLAMGQATSLLLLPWPAMLIAGAIMWSISAWIFRTGARRFTRDRLASHV